MTTPATPDLDYFAMQREHRALDLGKLEKRARVAVLSDASTQHLLPLLRVLFARAGYAAEIFAGEYGALETEILDPSAALYGFAPEVVILLPATQAFRARHRDSTGDRSLFGEQTALHLASLWDALARNARVTIIQATIAIPCERELGSYDLVVPDSLLANALTLNAGLAREARSREGVLLCDIEGIASWVGKRAFLDEKLWAMARAFAAFEHLPRVAQALVDIVLAARGRVRKAVVVDLDDTMWGGVIGDDGMEGIRIGHDGDGDAFRGFQQWLRELSRRGIVLAVCSKNDPDIAIRPFREHPEMVLREEDIAVFVASWGTKVDGLKRIRDTLEIGFDAIVFLDDNPFERNLVRHHLPDVIVPELPEDPAERVAALSELNLFAATTYTDEDKTRGAAYRAESSRKALAQTFTNIDEFLASLDMRVTLARFDPQNLARIAQLLQRSNQFNLTTRRESEADCKALMDAGPDVLPIYVKLADKLGDHGLISVVIARVAAEALEIDTWVMSCRVLARGVEAYAMNHLLEHAKERGLLRVIGHYAPTAKNGMVEDFYGRFGFEKTTVNAAGASTWVLDVASYSPLPHHLTETKP